MALQSLLKFMSFPDVLIEWEPLALFTCEHLVLIEGLIVLNAKKGGARNLHSKFKELVLN